VPAFLSGLTPLLGKPYHSIYKRGRRYAAFLQIINKTLTDKHLIAKPGIAAKILAAILKY
jgi:hypothetical protein